MKVLGWKDSFGPGDGARGSVLAIGVFDGIHLGHRSLIGRIIEESAKGMLPAILSFTVNPRRFFHPDSHPGDIMTVRQKIEAFGGMGLEAAIMVDFDPDFAAMEGQDFLGALIERFALRFLVMGENTHIGSGARNSAAEISMIASSLGIGSAILPALKREGKTVSSSLIRKEISEGRMSAAAELLGRPWELDLRAWKMGGGRAYVESAMQEQILPPIGRYRCRGPSGEGLEVDLSTEGQLIKICSIESTVLPERLAFV